MSAVIIPFRRPEKISAKNYIRTDIVFSGADPQSFSEMAKAFKVGQPCPECGGVVLECEQGPHFTWCIEGFIPLAAPAPINYGPLPMRRRVSCVTCGHDAERCTCEPS